MHTSWSHISPVVTTTDTGRKLRQPCEQGEWYMHPLHLGHAPWTVRDDIKHLWTVGDNVKHPWTVRNQIKTPLVVRDDFKHRHHTVTQPPHYASLFVRNNLMHCTRCANALITIRATFVGADVKHLWYDGNDDKYRLHTVRLNWVNAKRFVTPIQFLGTEAFNFSAVVGDDVSNLQQAPTQQEL